MATPVVIDYSTIINPENDLTRDLEAAFGPNGIGLVVVRGVPGFIECRQALLPLAAAFAALPDEVKTQYEDEQSSFNVGWSCGREILENAQPDRMKGSYYANPLQDVPTTDKALLSKYPSDLRPNIWPTEHLPQLEGAFKQLGGLIIEVGLALMKHCDRYVATQLGDQLRNSKEEEEEESVMHDAIAASICNKGRLLHYFPITQETSPSSSNEPSSESPHQNWCGWHRDHGLLTGLASAMYLDAEGRQQQCSDTRVGLHVRDRSGNVVRVVIREDELAFQVGEVLQILSGGRLQSTPHAVFGTTIPGLSRNTFAVFMQPNFDYPLHCPKGTEPEAVGVEKWQPGGMTFGEFAKRKFDVYYK